MHQGDLVRAEGTLSCGLFTLLLLLLKTCRVAKLVCLFWRHSTLNSTRLHHAVGPTSPPSYMVMVVLATAGEKIGSRAACKILLESAITHRRRRQDWLVRSGFVTVLRR